ncbi:MAG: hypothetical protein Q9218_001893 [Villophora microphyllina]
MNTETSIQAGDRRLAELFYINGTLVEQIPKPFILSDKLIVIDLITLSGRVRNLQHTYMDLATMISSNINGQHSPGPLEEHAEPMLWLRIDLLGLEAKLRNSAHQAYKRLEEVNARLPRASEVW